MPSDIGLPYCLYKPQSRAWQRVEIPYTPTLLGTPDKGMVYNPDVNRGLEVFVYADFAGNRDKDDPASRRGYIKM